MKKGLSFIIVNFFVVVLFIVAALAYFHPVLQGKVIYQRILPNIRGWPRSRTISGIRPGPNPIGPTVPSVECLPISWVPIIPMTILSS